MNADDKIRAILKMEADAVEPSPAGWDAIQRGVASRRARPWWTAGAALAGAAAVFLGATAYVAMNDGDRGVRGVPVPPAATGPRPGEPTGSAPPPPVAPAAPARPIGAIWPLTTTDEVAAWEADPASMPALKTSRGAALAFARRYLLLDEAEVAGSEAFGVSELVVRDRGSAVTTLTVKGFGPDGTAPFAVVHAESRKLRVTSPEPRALVPATFEARGTYEESDPDLRVELLADGNGTARSAAGVETDPTIDPPEWHARLSLDLAKAPRRTGSVLVTLRSGPDGRVTSAAAVPVAFRAGSPEAMVAAREGRIAVLSTVTGQVVRWLTEPVPGAGASEPELSDDGKTVVYVQSTGTCASEIRSVPVDGGQPATLVSGEGRLSHPTRRREVLAYVRTRCAGGESDEEVVVRFGERVAGVWPGPVSAGPVAGDRFVAFGTVTGDGAVVRAVDPLRKAADMSSEPFESSAWTALAWGPGDGDGTERLYGTIEGETEDDPVTALALHRFDADLGNSTRVGTVEVFATYLDYAGGDLVAGTEDRAYVVDGDSSRAILGVAQRPTWS